MDETRKKDIRSLILQIFLVIVLTAIGYFVSQAITEKEEAELPQRIEAVLTEADAQDEKNSKINIQEVRMAQLVEYEIEGMYDYEIFMVVKTHDGAIVRTIINQPLAEALTKHYK